MLRYAHFEQHTNELEHARYPANRANSKTARHTGSSL